jgi:predicted nuclease of predicted toxin-antitoxin system
VKLWLDAHLSPKLVPWLCAEFDLQASALRDLGLRHAKDPQIFAAARNANAVVATKDRDLVDLVDRHGPPPQVLWITMGNTSNRYLRQVLSRKLPEALGALSRGEPVVELTEVPGRRGG